MCSHFVLLTLYTSTSCLFMGIIYFAWPSRYIGVALWDMPLLISSRSSHSIEVTYVKMVITSTHMLADKMLSELCS